MWNDSARDAAWHADLARDRGDTKQTEAFETMANEEIAKREEP